MTRGKSLWRLVVMSYPCPTCDAAPGMPCMTSTGNPKWEHHAARALDLERCPKCGAWVGANEDPGALCNRCALVRALEIERATTWQRRD